MYKYHPVYLFFLGEEEHFTLKGVQNPLKLGSDRHFEAWQITEHKTTSSARTIT